MTVVAGVTVRPAQLADFAEITRIYNEGIEDREATLEADPKSVEQVREMFSGRQPRHELIVAEIDGNVAGWASLNPYSHRCAYDAVADLSVYVERSRRGQGIGEQLLVALEARARSNGFHKIVLFTFPFNEAGQRLYRKRGFRDVGVFKEQGLLDGKPIDVLAMEKLL